MPAMRKRVLHEEADVEPPSQTQNAAVQPPRQQSALDRLRNMWQFANLFQFILLFGKPLKLDDSLDMEDFEAECLKPGSMFLQEIGLGLLKFLSSHRGLNHDLFDEYSRRQYISKAPDKNPFGTDETPARFADFDVFKKVRVLQQMTQFIMRSSERLREKTEEQKDMDQTNWRIEPYGWDSDDRTYFVLDDNRIYRLTEAPPPPIKPKKGSKKARASLRASKRRRVSTAAASDTDEAEEEPSATAAAGPAPKPEPEPEDDGFGGMKWECIAVNLEEVRKFLSTIQKSRDDNEQVLRKQIQDHLVPILEKQEESAKRKQLQREKELQNLEKLAHAKRSSRIASKAEQQKMDEQAREEERKRQEEQIARRKEEQQRAKFERERERRLVSREKRLKEREVRRLQHEEELAQLSEDSKSVGSGPGRMSERHRLAEIEKNRVALREIEEEESDWVFDCICGVYGQVDDGTHSVACERCNVWQHSKCLGIDEAAAEQDDFHFICSPCRKIEQAEKEPRPRIIKLKVNRPGSPSSDPPQQEADDGSASGPARSQLVVELPSKPSSGMAQLNGSSSHGAAMDTGRPEDSATTPTKPAKAYGLEQSNGNSSAGPRSRSVSPKRSPKPQQYNPFSSPHPNLSPPGQSPNKSRAYGTIFDRSSPAPDGQASAINGTLPVLSPPAASGGGSSPSKHRFSSPPGTKTTPSVFSTSRESGATISSRNLSGTPSASAIMPQFTPVQSQSQSFEGRSDERPSPLPPSRGGLSPTKHSPTIRQQPLPSANASFNSVASTASGASHSAPVFPPAAALSPSLQEQILTPPVKSAESARDSP
ncbi:hypothetical protein B0T22DRAFT_488566 [Podospora appendiculata]|uniref:Zinc finger PHD-type domain-containing protein n=1 Tax=Podospora appendiculata TaxID=314037 RepID=A0AAE1CID0_9PEZI|nr:hypothetical protein B0T22DRAFT_488566 [Podospora appendiculata]